MSTTVTVDVQVLVLLLLSVTVKVTVFVPTLEQSKVDLLIARLFIPQASLLPLFTWAAVNVPTPLLFNVTVTG